MRDMRAKEKEAGENGSSGANGQTGPDGEGPQEERPRGGSLRQRRLPPARAGAIHLFNDQEERPGSEEGGVWEEEVSEESLKKLLSKPPSGTDATEDAESQPRESLETTASVRTVTVTAAAQSSTTKAR